MKRAEKTRRIMEILDRLYPKLEITLEHRDPFTLLVAVILSAQTTDKKVDQVTPALFARAPTPASMAAMTVEEILVLIRQVGLAPQKAKALRGTATLLRDEYDGAVPQSLEELCKLPGVGRKTANVMLAQAFGQAAFPVDTHINRLAHRWGLSHGKSPEQTERDLCRAFPKTAWSRLHLQIITFGREHCPARRHDMRTCPICSWAAPVHAVRAHPSSA